MTYINTTFILVNNNMKTACYFCIVLWIIKLIILQHQDVTLELLAKFESRHSLSHKGFTKKDQPGK